MGNYINTSLLRVEMLEIAEIVEEPVSSIQVYVIGSVIKGDYAV